MALVGVAAVGLLMSMVFLASAEPATGYELAIYDAYPLAFWGALTAALVAGTAVLVVQSYARTIAKRYLIGCVIIDGICGVVLVLLPVARGYAFYGRHDPLTHIGMILDIRETGHVGPSNFYPVLHILSDSVALVLGVDAVSARAFIPAVLLIVFYAGVFFLILSVTHSSASALRALAFAFLPLYPSITAFTPSDTLFLYTPFILYLFYAGRPGGSLRWRLLFFLALLQAPFAHPEIVIFLSLFFASLALADLWTRAHTRGAADVFRPHSSSPLLVLGAAFFLWFSSFSAFGSSITRVRGSLAQETLQSPIQTYQALFARSGLSTVDLALLVAKTNGAQMLVVVSATYLLVRSIGRSQVSRDQLGFGLAGAILIVLVILSLATNFILSYNRLLKYVVLMGSLAIALSLPTTMQRDRRPSSASSSFAQPWQRRGPTRIPWSTPASLLSVVCVAALVSTVSLYPSPIVLQPNDQVTASDFAGASWLIAHANEQLPTSDVIAIGRYIQALEGYDHSLSRSPELAEALYQPSRAPPPHFDFANAGVDGASPATREYLIIDGYTVSLYCALFPTRGRFDCTDFGRLGREPEMNSIYSNGAFQVWFVDIPP